MAGDDRSADTDEIHVTQSNDCFVARDVSTGVASQGETKPEALEMLAEALELHAADSQFAEVDA